jgi:hypothetical protein
MSQTRAMQWDGTSWTVVPSANRPGYIPWENALWGIACTALKGCFAVGGSRIEDRNGVQHEPTLVERWDGTRFGIVASPNGAKDIYQSLLEAITCPTARVCFATGHVDTGAAHRFTTFILRSS